jgi:hypothetical protein
MKSKRNLKKRLEKLEKEREAKETLAYDPAEIEVDDEVVDALIAVSEHRLTAPAEPLPSDLVASLPPQVRDLCCSPDERKDGN